MRYPGSVAFSHHPFLALLITASSAPSYSTFPVTARACKLLLSRICLPVRPSPANAVDHNLKAVKLGTCKIPYYCICIFVQTAGISKRCGSLLLTKSFLFLTTAITPFRSVFAQDFLCIDLGHCSKSSSCFCNHQQRDQESWS